MVDVGQVLAIQCYCGHKPIYYSVTGHTSLDLCVLQKDATVRTATASAIVQLNHTAFEAIAADGMMAKGHVLTVAQLAGGSHTIAAVRLAIAAATSALNDGFHLSNIGIACAVSKTDGCKMLQESWVLSRPPSSSLSATTFRWIKSVLNCVWTLLSNACTLKLWPRLKPTQVLM